MAGLFYFADATTTPEWVVRGRSPVLTAAQRKQGANYTRYEDLYHAGDTFLAALARLVTPACVTLPPDDVFEYPAFSQGTYGLVYSPSKLLGLSGSGDTTIVQQAPNTISSANISYSNGLTTSNTSNLYAMISQGGMDSPELSNLHFRGTEQSGVLHYPLEWQSATNVILENLLISGFPGGLPKPPTEAGGINSLSTTYANGTVTNLRVDGRRYDPSTNVPGASVSSSMLMPNSMTTATNFVDCSFTGGINQSVALWHSQNLTFTDCVFDGIINHEESGFITYVRPRILSPAVYHYASVNDVGPTTFIDPSFAPSQNAKPGALFFAHLISGSPSGTVPIIHLNGVPQQIYAQNPDNSFSTWMSA